MDRVGERGNTMRRVGAVTIIVLAVAALGGVAGAQVNIDPLKVEREVLTQEVADPTQIEVAPDGRVIIGEREGAIKVWRQDGTLIESGRIPVAGNACASCPDKLLEEGGLHGLLLDRNFMRTGKIYVHYSVPGSRKAKTQEGKFRIATFVLRKDKLDLKSRKTILEIPAEWDHCCHYGGDMTWMKDGTILLSVGDDSSPREDMYNPRDKRKGRRAFDADRTAGNPRDLRGKILRFTATGGVPKNNPHVGDKRYNPYVYAMGLRSDYRIGYDPVTGAVYVGNVGPDAYGSDPNRGPAGMDELETIPPGGGTNHGWPRCIGNNTPYMDYDYASGESKGPLSCKGMTPATIYIPYGPSEEFPGMGLGPRTLMSGPPYRYTGKGALQLDGAFQGKLIFWDFMRGVFWTAPIGDKGKLDTAQITSFHFHAPNSFAGAVPNLPTSPIDAEIGPDGALYIAEYGSGFYNNPNSAVSRLKCMGCTATSADYLGAKVRTPELGPVETNTAASASRLTLGTREGLLVGMLLLVIVGLSRRRRVV
jgi:glucose/arabinose dehydrogenase